MSAGSGIPDCVVCGKPCPPKPTDAFVVIYSKKYGEGYACGKSCAVEVVLDCYPSFTREDAVERVEFRWEEGAMHIRNAGGDA